MNRSQFISEFADRCEVSKSDAKNMLQVFEEIVTETVSAGEAVTLTNFCKFWRQDVKARKAGTMISPFTKEEIKVAAKPASVRPKVTVLRGFKEAVVSKGKKKTRKRVT